MLRHHISYLLKFACNCIGSMHAWLAGACSLLSMLYVASPSCPNSAHSTYIHRTHLSASLAILFQSVSQCPGNIMKCFVTASCSLATSFPLQPKEGALLSNVSFLSEIIDFHNKVPRCKLVGDQIVSQVDATRGPTTQSAAPVSETHDSE